MRRLPFFCSSIFRGLGKGSWPLDLAIEPSGLLAVLAPGAVPPLDESPPCDVLLELPGLLELPPNLRMIPRCFAYRADGRICGEPANNLDLRNRGFPTCDEHSEAEVGQCS